eukprot:m.717747 g.717747  ORF g.717747 m.717747 type:complete len:206 (-) comp22988_c0_seq9:2176-2793(-)
MGKRGMSLEEKQRKLLQFFYTTKKVYTGKEIEKVASKQTGISSMVIKDILQNLMDDNKVDFDKIGSSNYYWAFPSKGLNLRQNEIAKLDADITALKEKKAQLLAKKKKLLEKRQPTTARSSALSSLKRLKSEEKQLRSEVSKLADLDPEVLKAKQEKVRVAQDAANRWTDNVFAIKSYCKKKFGNFDDEQLDKAFGIPADFDYPF